MLRLSGVFLSGYSSLGSSIPRYKRRAVARRSRGLPELLLGWSDGILGNDERRTYGSFSSQPEWTPPLAEAAHAGCTLRMTSLLKPGIVNSPAPLRLVPAVRSGDRSKPLPASAIDLHLLDDLRRGHLRGGDDYQMRASFELVSALYEAAASVLPRCEIVLSSWSACFSSSSDF